MVSSDKKLSNVVGGKTARACDSCIRKRARWYCAADDAFLCQGCDASVHSANPLARRHERVRLKTSCSTSPTLKFSLAEKSSPSWHHGFTRKARTPRGGAGKQQQAFRRTSPGGEITVRSFPIQLVVPEIGGDDQSTSTHGEDNVSDEQLLYQVPVFDPQLCFSANSNEVALTPTPYGAEDPSLTNRGGGAKAAAFDLNSLNGLILPSDMELAEFAADVETLLGKGLDEESFDMEGLGLLDSSDHDQKGSTENSPRRGERALKVEEEEEGIQCEMSNDIDLMRGPFQLNFDYDSTITWGEEEEEEEKIAAGAGEVMAGLTAVVKEDHDQLYDGGCIDVDKEKKILKLDYEGVMAAWDGKRSPWTTGDRPEFDPNLCWPDCMGGCGMLHHPYGDHRMGMMTTGNPAMLDGGREARVSRYREKRRTRLFSKKIRYEVRKLNAEKRPRMKGRFVKRASFGAPIAFPLLAK